MIGQRIRLMVLFGLLVLGLTAPGTVMAPTSTSTHHHQDVVCGPGPDC